MKRKAPPKNHRHSVTFKDVSLERKVCSILRDSGKKFTDFAEEAIRAHLQQSEAVGTTTVNWQAISPDSGEFDRALEAIRKLASDMLKTRGSIERSMPRDRDQLDEWLLYRRNLVDAISRVDATVNRLVNISRIARFPEDCAALERLYERATKGEVSNAEILNLLRFWTGRNFTRFSKSGGSHVA